MELLETTGLCLIWKGAVGRGRSGGNLPQWVAKPENAKQSVQGKKTHMQTYLIIFFIFFFNSTALEIGL